MPSTINNPIKDTSEKAMIQSPFDYQYTESSAQTKVSGSLGIPDKSFKQILLIKPECWPIVTYTQGPIIDSNNNLASFFIMYDGIFEQIGYQYICQATVHADESFLA